LVPLISPLFLSFFALNTLTNPSPLLPTLSNANSERDADDRQPRQGRPRVRGAHSTLPPLSFFCSRALPLSAR
jgi:hypothetical protein